MKLTQEELEKVQKISSDTTRLKISLGELELQKQQLLNHSDEIKSFANSIKIELTEKYGSNCVIDVITGEITKEEDEVD